MKNNTGWICPLCGVANAPWKEKCDCVNEHTFTPILKPWVYNPYPYKLPQTWSGTQTFSTVFEGEVNYE